LLHKIPQFLGKEIATIKFKMQVLRNTFSRFYGSWAKKILFGLLLGGGIGVLIVFFIPKLGKEPPFSENSSSTEMSSSIVELPESSTEGELSLERALQKRRSVREYTNEPLAISDVSQILWAGQGITSELGGRTAPSAGALYPLEIYVAVGNVSGLADGVYKYEPDGHILKKVLDGDVRDRLSKAALGQKWVGEGAIVLVISGVFERTTAKYGERGIRYVHMEVGHVAENVYLQAESLGLGTVFVGAFDEGRVKETMRMEDEEELLGIMPVGKK
jgi:SagB-type dehydrogenase family enzyme